MKFYHVKLGIESARRTLKGYCLGRIRKFGEPQMLVKSLIMLCIVPNEMLHHENMSV